MKNLRQFLSATANALCTVLLLTLLAACMPPQNNSSITIESPVNGTVITSLTEIEGTYYQGGEQQITEVRLYILRYSDGKFWDGSAWGGGGSAVLPVSRDINSWHWTGGIGSTLPSGSNLGDGYYDIMVFAKYADGTEVRADSVVAVGVTAPPSTSTLYAWGDDGVGQTGIGSSGVTFNQPTPVARSIALEGKVIVAVTAGGIHSLALTTEGRVYAWGGNANGLLGRGVNNTVSSEVPVEVDMSGALSGKKVAAIAASLYHSLAVTSDGQVFGWGDNSNGVLGNGSTTTATAPVPVDMTGYLNPYLNNGKTVKAVCAGHNHSVARTSDGKLFSWGRNFSGQLGTGNNTDSLVPVPVVGLDDKFVVAVATGFEYTLALTSEGKVYAFGLNSYGSLGNGLLVASNVPVLAGATGGMAGKKIRAISTVNHHNLALDSDGKVYAWGDNLDGQIGNGGIITQPLPIEIGGALAGKIVTRISAGYHSS